MSPPLLQKFALLLALKSGYSKYKITIPQTEGVLPAAFGHICTSYR